MDYEGNGFLVKLGQELSLSTFLEFSVSSRRMHYSERYLYGINGVIDYTVIGGSQTITDRMRRDETISFETKLIQDINYKVKVELNYQYTRLDSNGNHFDWGPEQSEDENAPGDERLVRDYYGYESTKAGSGIRVILTNDSYLRMSGHYQTKDYTGRLAKNQDDEFLSPEEKRKDRQIFVSLNWVRDLIGQKQKDSPVTHLELRIGYSYQNNQSNDALYDYSNNVISISLATWF